MKTFWKEGLLDAPYGEIKRKSVLVLAWNATAWLKSISAPVGATLTLSPASLIEADERLEILAQTVIGSKIVARIQVKADGGATTGAMMPLKVITEASDSQREQFDFFLNLVEVPALACVC